VCCRGQSSPRASRASRLRRWWLAREDYLDQIAVADAQTMRDQTVLFVDFNELNERVGRTFRSIPSEVELIVANLSLANMDFAGFVASVDSDGYFVDSDSPGARMTEPPSFCLQGAIEPLLHAASRGLAVVCPRAALTIGWRRLVSAVAGAPSAFLSGSVQPS
jgi:hypothetical protein